MYRCDNCNSIFATPQFLSLDCGPIYYHGAVRPYAPPDIPACPMCRSTQYHKIITPPFIQSNNVYERREYHEKENASYSSRST